MRPQLKKVDWGKGEDELDVRTARIGGRTICPADADDLLLTADDCGNAFLCRQIAHRHVEPLLLEITRVAGDPDGQEIDSLLAVGHRQLRRRGRTAEGRTGSQYSGQKHGRAADWSL